MIFVPDEPGLQATPQRPRSASRRMAAPAPRSRCQPQCQYGASPLPLLSSPAYAAPRRGRKAVSDGPARSCLILPVRARRWEAPCQLKDHHKAKPYWALRGTASWGRTALPVVADVVPPSSSAWAGPDGDRIALPRPIGRSRGCRGSPVGFREETVGPPRRRRSGMK